MLIALCIVEMCTSQRGKEKKRRKGENKRNRGGKGEEKEKKNDAHE